MSVKSIKAALLVFVLSVGAVGAQRRTFDVTTFVVLGEGLAAGMSDFTLRDVSQDKSFPAQMARQMETLFPQPLIQSPGIANAPGFPSLPVRVPAAQQTTVRYSPPTVFVFNLSVPGMKVADAVSRRPVSPLVQNDAQQTAINMILGFPALLIPNAPLWSQLEYANQMRPTVALVELGYYEVLEAAATGNLSLLPDVAAFRTNYSRILSTLRGAFVEVVVTNIPDPIDTAYFTSISGATRLVGAPAGVITRLYNLRADDLLTIHGINAIGNQITAKEIRTLPPNSVMSAASADQVRQRVRALNAEIASLAQQSGAVLYDMNAFFSRARSQGIVVGTRALSADFLGGIYSLNGYYPGAAVHAIIANEILELLNRTYRTSFRPVDVAPLLPPEPVTKQGAAREYTLEELEQFIPNIRELMAEESSPQPSVKQ